MSIALVGHTKIAGATGGTTPGIDTTTANFIIISVGYKSTSIIAPTDNQGNTYTPLTSQTYATTTSYNRLYYCSNPITNASHTFITTALTSSIQIAAFSGVETNPFDKEAGNQGIANPIKPGSITPAENGSLIITGISFGTLDVVSIDSSFSITDQNNFSAGINQGGALAYLIQTSSAITNPNWTFSIGGGSATTIAAFDAIPTNLSVSRNVVYDLISTPTNKLSTAKNVVYDLISTPTNKLSVNRQVSYIYVEPLTTQNIVVNGTGVYVNANIGSLTVNFSSNISLIGVSSNIIIGSSTPAINIGINGVSSNVVVGSLSIQEDRNISIDSVFSNVVVSSLNTSLSPNIVIDGVSSNVVIGSLGLHIDSNLSINGVNSNVVVVAPTVKIDTAISGVSSNIKVGTLSFESGPTVIGTASNVVVGGLNVAIEGSTNLIGVSSAVNIGNLLIVVSPNFTDINIGNVHSTIAVNSVNIELGPQLIGINSNVMVSNISVIISQSGFTMDNLQATTIPMDTDDIGVTLKYSNTAGASWAGTRTYNFANTGDYNKNVLFRRLGIARDRVFEVSWSAPVKTAVTGLFVNHEILES